jgi:mitogen-activated protein kinase kinase 2
MSTKSSSSKKSPDLKINVDLNRSAIDFESTFRAEGISVSLNSIRIDGEHVDMEVCISDLIVEGKIGEGACSTVRAAVHRKTGAMYAVKMFNVYNKSQRSQLFNEVHMLKDVQCEALVCFCGAFYTDGCVGVILEYMDRGSLDSIVSSKVSLTESAAGGILYQVLWGLAYLHHDKNVHRDVKPGNTLMNSQGHVKLSDFGISRQLDGTTEMSNTYVGTFRFMSPERLLGDGYNSKGDIWSVGE